MMHMWRSVALLAVMTSLGAGCGTASTSTGAPKIGGDADATSVDTTTDTASDTAPSDSGVQDAGTKDSTPADADSGGPACHPTKPEQIPCPKGQHCVYSNSVLVCEDDGEHGAGEDCEDGKGCKIGICVQSEAGNSACAPHCFGNLDCASKICNNLKDSKGKVCDMGEPSAAQCDPLAQNCSEPGEACFATNSGFVCKLAGNVASGSPCPEFSSCKKDLVCVGKSSSGGVCQKICNQAMDTGPNCNIGVKCTPLLGSGTVGFCQE